MSSHPHVLLYVQYLEGIGHVVRAKRIAESLIERGCKVTLVLGGPPIPGFAVPGANVLQLPPLSAGPTSYSMLLTADGSAADDAFKTDRRDRLIGIFSDARPDIVVTEGYPMGRWAMDFELVPLLECASRATPRPLIVASLRDILQMPKSTEKSDRSIAHFRRYYDHMLIHGDPRMVRVEDSFPPIASLLQKATYTGLVAPRLPSVDEPGAEFDVIVSAGGGAIAYEVLQSAILAKPATRMAGASWLAVTGPRLDDTDYADLQRLARSTDVTLERFRPDLAGHMRRARISIQRAGYNTVADMLVAGCRAVLVPDADNNQMEQPLRARRLAALSRAIVVEERNLTAETMADAIERAMNLPVPHVQFDLEGAARSADALIALCNQAP